MSSVFMLVFFLILLFLGIPVLGAMGLGAILYIVLFMNIPMNIVASQVFAGVNSIPLMAIPFFIIAGALMENGGISKRIVAFANSLVGHFPGGFGLAVVVASAFFAAMTGSGAACVAAIGGMMIPAMVDNGYDKDFACALQAAGGSLGPIIPPSILMVLYSCCTSNSVGAMLLAGVIPGLMIAAAFAIVTLVISKKRGYKGTTVFSWKNVFVTLKSSIWALLTPAIILGGIYSGIFTPTEASAVSCLYAIIVGFFVYRELTVKALISSLFNSIKLIGQILGIVATTQLFSWILTRQGLPQMIATACAAFSDTPVLFLMLSTVVLLVVGCFLDPVPAVLIFAPILTPAAIAMGLDPIHFGTLMVITFCIGLITPPVGMTLFVASGIGERPVIAVAKKIWPFVIAMLVCVVIMIFVPQIVTFLPYAGSVSG